MTGGPALSGFLGNLVGLNGIFISAGIVRIDIGRARLDFLFHHTSRKGPRISKVSDRCVSF